MGGTFAVFFHDVKNVQPKSGRAATKVILSEARHKPNIPTVPHASSSSIHHALAFRPRFSAFAVAYCRAIEELRPVDSAPK